MTDLNDIPDPNVQLMKALVESNWEAARKSLENGADINHVFFQIKKPLLNFFTAQGNQKAVEFCLDNGADINFVSNTADGHTPLLESILSSKVNIFNLLIERGADVNVKNHQGVSPLIQAMWIPNALPYVEKLLEKDADVNVQSNYGVTPLLAALGTPQSHDVISAVLKKNPDPTPLGDMRDGILLAAACVQNKDRVKIFLDVLEYCAPYIERKEINIEQKGRSNMTVLAFVAGFDADMTYALLQKGASPHEVSHNHLYAQSSALMLLARKDYSGELIEPLLQQKVNVNHRDSSGNNVLTYALALGLEGKSGVIQMLLDAGLDSKAPLTENGLSPFHLAIDFEPTIEPEEDESDEDYEARVIEETNLIRVATVNKLLEMGFPPYPDIWIAPQKDYVGGERFKEAVKLLPPPLVEAIITDKEELADLLLNAVDSVNALNNTGMSLLHHMASFDGTTVSSTDIMKSINDGIVEKAKISGDLLNTGINKDAKQVKKEVQSQTKKEFDEHLRKNVSKVVQKLNEKGADWNVPSKEGKTPLQNMARLNNHELLGCLIAKHNVDCSYRDNDFQSIADYALNAGSGHALFAILGYFQSKGKLKEFDDLLINVAFEENPSELGRFKMKERNKKVQILELVLSKFPSLLEARDDSGNTPLIIAASQGNRDLVSRFLKHGADVNAANDLGETAIIHAAIQNDQTLVHTLMQGKADIYKTANNGVSAISLIPDIGEIEIREDEYIKPAADLNEKSLEVINAYMESWSKNWPSEIRSSYRSRRSP